MIIFRKITICGAVVFCIFVNYVKILFENTGTFVVMTVFILVIFNRKCKIEMRHAVMVMMGNKSMRQHHNIGGKYCQNGDCFSHFISFSADKYKNYF